MAKRKLHSFPDAFHALGVSAASRRESRKSILPPKSVLPLSLRERIRNLTFLGLAVVVLSLSSCGGGNPGASAPAAPAVAVTVSPPTASLTVGATQQFTPTVTNATNKAVTWSVNDVAGGNSTVGTITANGLCTAPVTVPNPPCLAVAATSQADPSKTAAASVSLSYPVPSLASISPTSALLASIHTTLTLQGSGFTRASAVSLNGKPPILAFVSGSQLTATVPASAQTVAGIYPVTVANPRPAEAHRIPSTSP
jgi:hypothetical protein